MRDMYESIFDTRFSFFLLKAPYSTMYKQPQLSFEKWVESLSQTRFQLGVTGLIVAAVCRRVFHLKESVVWRQQANEKRSRNIGKILMMFGSRLLATGGCWFLWDFSFYGNKGEHAYPLLTACCRYSRPCSGRSCCLFPCS